MEKENYSLYDSITGFEILQVVFIMDFLFLKDYTKCYIKEIGIHDMYLLYKNFF